jgi:tRNA nucleotidyltransferase (CCA-adding enzyme)
MVKNPKLSDKWFRTLPADAHSAVRSLIELADRAGVVIYLVGGPLRDTLLGRPSLDIDLAVEADAPSLALALGEQLGAPVTVHRAFGTATIRGSGWHIDLATTRTETYRRPGALPHVTPATINDDLRRRDFTINAMAVPLNGPNRGSLIDPCGGQRDVTGHAIRVLHERSFQDDATRILRAARYAHRLAFHHHEQTAKWMRRDTGYLQTISPARIHHELARILLEPELEAILLALHGTGALRALHPALRFDGTQANGFREVRTFGVSPHAAYWPLLVWPEREADAKGISSRIALTRRQIEAVESLPRNRDLPTRLSRDDRPSQSAALLATVPIPALYALAAMTDGRARQRILDYLHRGRTLKTRLRGDDVLALGVPQGPRVGEMLRRLRVAKLDGDVKTRRDEERYVRKLLAEASQK